MFNRSCMKLPPRNEKWIMEMQDEMVMVYYAPEENV